MESKLKEKNWDKKFEEEIFNYWLKDWFYDFKKDNKKPIFSIDTPPPYINAPIHMGHAATYSMMDMFARYKRMKGFNVIFPLGMDRNGLPIEVQAEKIYNVKMKDVPREKFLNLCKEMLNKFGNESIDSFKKLGISFNSWDVKYRIGGAYETDDKEYRKLTQETFIDMWNKGLIYEDYRPSNYCPVCQTTIADSEIEYEEKKTLLNYIWFDVENGEKILIATTRPELIGSCKAIIYNPNDERYKHLKNKKAIVPIYNYKVPLIPHSYAKKEFGTGLVMISSFGDTSDIQIFRELKLKPIYLIDKNGKLNANAGKYEGLTIKEARKEIINDLKKENRLEKQEEIIHRQPICWRSKTPIEFIPMKEYYLKQVEFKEELKKIIRKIKFYAPESKQILLNWIDSVTIDWPISRERYYGTEIPIWTCKKCGRKYVPEKGKYYQPWKEKLNKKCECGANDWEGETKTFDTWFDSSISELYILGYSFDKEFFKKSFPCTLRPQGKEIIRTWLYYTLLRAYLLFKKPAFKDVWVNMHIVDNKGQKMSKSLGNVIDPQEIIRKYGGEALRIWVALEGEITKGDLKCSFERIEGNAKFLNKLWNISKFISMFNKPHKKPKLCKTDEWIINEINNLVDFAEKNYNKYNINNIAKKMKNFIWEKFASHYIELVKKRVYNTNNEFSKEEQESGIWTLYYVLERILKILAPIIPFITEKIWINIFSKESIHKQKWPTKEKINKKILKIGEKLIKFNSKIWKIKKEQNKSLKTEIKIKIPKELEIFKKDLIAMHNII